MRMMKKAGCLYLQFGIESGSKQILAQFGKRISTDVMYKACMNCKEVGLDYFNSFMIGGPKETRESVKETIEYAIKLDSIMVGFNILIPYPGTAIFKKYYREMEFNNDWSKWNHLTHDVPIDYRHTELTKDDLDEIRKDCIRKYYLRPKHILRMLFFFRSFTLLRDFLKASWNISSFFLKKSFVVKTMKKLSLQKSLI